MLLSVQKEAAVGHDTKDQKDKLINLSIVASPECMDLFETFVSALLLRT